MNMRCGSSDLSVVALNASISVLLSEFNSVMAETNSVASKISFTSDARGTGVLYFLQLTVAVNNLCAGMLA